MNVEDVQFLLVWLLPGLVLGIIGTLVIQYMVGWYAFTAAVRVNAKTTCKAAQNDDDVVSAIFPKEFYQSSSGRVHRTYHCSNMKSWQKLQVCSKCFKVA